MKIGLIGFATDENSSFLRGAALAPPVIRSAVFSKSSNLWAENGINLEGKIFDAGDESSFGQIETSVDRLLKEGITPICLGGDHAITYPILRAIRKRAPRLAILHFDAHPDLYQDFQGNPHSHASPFARIMEERLADRLVQVGIRAANDHQRQQARKFSVEMIEMKNLNDSSGPAFDCPVYISMDMDALDPAFAPGVSHPEGGGLSTRQVVNMIQSISTPIVGADVVELNPTRDLLGITAAASAKIIKEIAGKMLEPMSGRV